MLSNLARLKHYSGVIAWLAAGATAVGIVMLNDLGRVLADIADDGQRAYGPAAFTGFKLTFWKTTDLQEAMQVWREASAGVGALTVIRYHVAVDTFFILAYSVLIFELLRRLEVSFRFSVILAGSVFLLDQAETQMTRWLLVSRQLSPVPVFDLGVLQFISLAKWLAVAAALATLVLSLRGRVVSAIQAAGAGHPQHPTLALAGLILLVGLFGGLVALPAGGPLEQIPDVLRYQLSRESDWSLRLHSGLALLLLAAAIAAAGLACTHSDYDTVLEEEGGTPASNRVVILLTLIWGLTIMALTWDRDASFNAVPLASFLMAVGVTAAAWLRQASQPEAVGEEAPAMGFEQGVATLWVGGLAGAIVVIGGLGLVRAAFLPIVLEIAPATGPLSWRTAVTIGVLTAVGGGLLVQYAVSVLGSRLAGQASPLGGLGALGAVGVLTLIAAIPVARHPTRAAAWGTTGVVAISFAVFACLVGLLKWVSRRYRPWNAIRILGFRRTPWLGLLVATWALASVLNTDGVYHDVRVYSQGHRAAPDTLSPPYADVATAFKRWVAAQGPACAAAPGRALPLVLVAAPGGGIRAAYWTAAALDDLFGVQRGDCVERRLFAVSGVSGGSVGTVTWLAARAKGQSGKKAVARMSKDGPLARAAAGLLLLDLPHPLAGIRKGWDDRAALLEDAWIDSAGAVFGSISQALAWAELGQGLPWRPVVVLNASSVTDGCRVLLSNLRGLPATRGSDCGTTRLLPGSGGPVTASIDPLLGLHPRGADAATGCGTYPTGMRAVTAALLSARFPIVSPSGALLRCVLDPVPAQPDSVSRTEVVTYAVDGGYYENSGLATLLQMWSAIEPLIRQHNDSFPLAPPIVPWILVLDNSYRSNARSAPPRRPLETIAPVRAFTSNRIAGQAALEQMAALAMGANLGRCRTPGPARDPRAALPGAAPIDSGSIGCLVVAAPTKSLSVEAPLGWVLSEISRADLDAQLLRLRNVTVNVDYQAISRALERRDRIRPPP